MSNNISKPSQLSAPNAICPPTGIGMDSLGTHLIRVQGSVGSVWLDYFDDISIIVSAPIGAVPITTICTHGADQAALVGILTRLYTFGYPILYVELLAIE